MLKLSAFVIGIFTLFLMGFPLRNWYDIKIAKKKRAEMEAWLQAKPSLVGYASAHPNESGGVSCFYCGGVRQGKRLKFTAPESLEFGVVYNKPHGTVSYFGYHCSACETELYRQKVTAT